MTGADGYSPENDLVIEKCKKEADADFFTEKYHCAEALVATIRKHFSPEVPDTVIKLVSGLGKGSGGGCICGAVSGAIIALSMVLPEDKARVINLSEELHTWFKSTYGATCCKILIKKRENMCLVSPGEVAGKIAEMLLRGSEYQDRKKIQQ